MRIAVFDDRSQLAAAAADIVHAGLPEFVGRALGVATGSTPLAVYAELGRRAAEGTLDAAGLSLIALDEYLGVGPADPGSYQAYVTTRIAGPLGVSAERVAVLNGLADPQAECRDFEARIARMGGVGIQIVGIGANGHLAFNEPGTPFDSRTHVVRLSEQTRQDNQAAFGQAPVPQYALTQGIGTVLEARRIVLLATGEEKADAVARALTGEPDVSCPASALQRHPDVVVLLDRAAASALPDPVLV